jgi:hypothetical protein
MSIPAVSGSPQSPAAADFDRRLAVMKKERDVEQITAEALIELVKQAGPQGGGRINTYA